MLLKELVHLFQGNVSIYERCSVNYHFYKELYKGSFLDVPVSLLDMEVVVMNTSCVFDGLYLEIQEKCVD